MVLCLSFVISKLTTNLVPNHREKGEKKRVMVQDLS